MWIIYHGRLLSLTMIIFFIAPKRLVSKAAQRCKCYLHCPFSLSFLNSVYFYGFIRIIMDILFNRFLSYESSDYQFSLKDFVDLKQIGSGGFSKVFKAFNLKWQRHFALKQFDLKMLSQNSLMNIQKEIEIHSQLKSPNVV